MPRGSQRLSGKKCVVFRVPRSRLCLRGRAAVVTKTRPRKAVTVAPKARSVWQLEQIAFPDSLTRELKPGAECRHSIFPLPLVLMTAIRVQLVGAAVVSRGVT